MTLSSLIFAITVFISKSLFRRNAKLSGIFAIYEIGGRWAPKIAFQACSLMSLPDYQRSEEATRTLISPQSMYKQNGHFIPVL